MVRLDGTNDQEGRALLAEADLPNVHTEATMLGAAKKVVELAASEAATRNDGGATPFLPSTQATANYQAFALKLLDARMVNHTSTTIPNAPLSAAAITALENPTPAQFPSTSVNEPASITC